MDERSKLEFLVGTSDSGEDISFNFKSSGHVLSVGEVGSGQSSFIEGAFVTDIIQNYSPDQVKLVMIDTKFVQLNQYATIPHLLRPIVTDVDTAKEALQSLLDEKQSRLDKFTESGVTNLDEYNAKEDTQLPSIILLIPEIADFSITTDKEFFHTSLVNLCLLTNRLGIHVHLGTSLPNETILPGILIANIVGRLVFRLSSEEYSDRLLFGRAKADNLSSPGELFYSNHTHIEPIKLKAPYVSNADIETIVQKVMTKP